MYDLMLFVGKGGCLSFLTLKRRLEHIFFNFLVCMTHVEYTASCGKRKQVLLFVYKCKNAKSATMTTIQMTNVATSFII